MADRARFNVYVICEELPQLSKAKMKELIDSADCAAIVAQPIAVGDCVDSAVLMEGRNGKTPRASHLRCVEVQHGGKRVVMEEFSS